ncbi:MAG: efflux system, outer rane lipoprotein NodT family, partial [Phenylobacterium sp.]|nr:efflux system, outer rane lipoprotein NodT family [Phenylobacterium sp.]
MNPFRLTASALFALSLAACAVGPNYKTPDTAPAALRNADPAAFVAANPEAAWWRQFEDPVLNQVVMRALSSNLDLRVALARVAEARALFTDQRLDQLPRFGIVGGSVQSRQQQPGSGEARVESETYQLGFDAAWEIDLFGRVRRGVQAAGAETDAARADLRDVQVTVAAEVARNYFELRGAQARLDVARRNLETQRDTVRITQARFDVGGADPIDILSAKARLSATEATIPTLITAERQAAHRLAVLAGERP